MDNTINKIAGKHLGQVGGAGYKDTYDPELLVKIPRHLNREQYKIQEDKLPFTGYDVWNAYEVSALTSRGLPVSGMMKIILPAESKYHVESKSLKLYLNSFNMTELGSNTEEVKREIEDRVQSDLCALLECLVECRFVENQVEIQQMEFENYVPLDVLVNLDKIYFKNNYTGLMTDDMSPTVNCRIRTNLLRSNCRVTNQPDWGDVFIHMENSLAPDFSSIAKYIVAQRKVNHFHEEICEMLFTEFKKVFHPEKLMVACLYTRRGGIDINPIRATDIKMVPLWFPSTNVLVKKTLRQ